jgi:hypothetical protein
MYLRFGFDSSSKLVLVPIIVKFLFNYENRHRRTMKNLCDIWLLPSCDILYIFMFDPLVCTSFICHWYRQRLVSWQSFLIPTL